MRAKLASVGIVLSILVLPTGAFAGESAQAQEKSQTKNDDGFDDWGLLGLLGLAGLAGLKRRETHDDHAHAGTAVR